MNVEPRSASDHFSIGGKPCDFTVGEFWQWSASDLLVNITRGAVAEFIVAKALRCTASLRSNWDPYDLVTPDGIKVEVKSASRRQAGPTKRPSRISFDIAPTVEWDAKSSALVGAPKRHADVYVFCLLENEDPQPADPLALDRWRFFVVSTKVINECCLEQKTVGLARLTRLKPTITDFGGIDAAVRRVNPGLPGNPSTY